MPFDPTLPTTNSNGSSAQMRAQFNALKDLCDAQQVQIDALISTVASQATQIAARPDYTTVEGLIASEAAKNVNAVDILSVNINDPPGQDEVQQMLDKLTEIITALKTA